MDFISIKWQDKCERIKEYGNWKKLKNARVESGFTQEYVAEKINVSRQTISNWENDLSQT